MTGQLLGRMWKRNTMAFLMLCLLVAPLHASAPNRRQQARSQFESAERMREELNGMPRKERSRRDYQRVMDAYRSVYYTAPDCGKADAAVVAVAELLAESGRAFNDEKTLRNAIGQYEFLRREYPGSQYRVGALLTIGQIYKVDLADAAKAREVFQEVITRYSHLQVAADARESIAEMDQQQRGKPKPADVHAAGAKPQETAPPDKSPDSKSQDAFADASRSGLPLITGIRHWSTPDYTRVAIDLEQEVKYEAGRVPNPDRIFFDLHDTRLASTLVGKTFDVSDSFLRRIRVAQFQKGMVRVVLEVDAVSDYSVFLLPNPYRLIVDIHGRSPNASAASQPPANSVQIAPAPGQGGKNLAAELGPKMPDGSFLSHTPSGDGNAGARDGASQRVTGGSAKKTTMKLPAKSPAVPVVLPVKRTPESVESARESGDTASASTASDRAPSQSPTAESSKAEVAILHGAEVKATGQPTSEPTVQVVGPRGTERSADRTPDRSADSSVDRGEDRSADSAADRNVERAADRNAERNAERTADRTPEKAEPAAVPKSPRSAAFRQAQPTADGQRSLIRALGLKVGRIVIDAGHGGHDTGTIGPGGLLEKDLVLDVSLRLGRLLQNKLGADVVYTRDDDTFVPLETRTAIANEQQADLFISIHANSSPDASARGVETYYLNFNPSPEALEVAARENALSEKSVHDLGDLVKKIALKDKVEESREFAIDVERSLHGGLAAKDSAIHDRGVKKALFIVLLGANMPSILTEISFISNPNDEHKMQTPEYRQKVAESLYKGIARYINGLSGVKVASKAGTAEAVNTPKPIAESRK